MHRALRISGGLTAAALLTVCAATASAAADVLSPTTSAATVSGTVTQPDGVRLAGMLVRAQVAGTAPASCTTAAGCFTTYSGSTGAYSLEGLAPATYELSVLDGARTVDLRKVTVSAGAATLTAPLRLGPPAVGAGTAARHARRDLGWLRAERARDGVPSEVTLNPRWSVECAAHDHYEATAGVLNPSEDPTATGASPGGAWAGLNSDLAEGRWTAAATPWEQAPVHLLALLAPSLSVTGIDDSGMLQCAITFPGMLRRWNRPDTVTTVPAPGANRVGRTEVARESPFTPVQFVGLAPSRRTGRELFVYLNRSGQLGQAPVRIVHAWLRSRGRALAMRWVDASTRTLGPYLAGGILIPLRPLAPHTRYRASVTVRDGARTLTRVWRFATR